MHITLANQVSGAQTTACIDRRTQTARILEWEKSYLETMCSVLKAMNVTDVEIVATPAQLQDLRTVGFTELRAYAVRRLNDA